MASTSSRVQPAINDDANLSSTIVDAGSSRRPHKRTKYSFSSSTKYRHKVKAAQPFLGFEDEAIKATIRGSLNLDERFFPYGMQPGNILEVKGPEKTGKTFLLTYFIVRALTVYPDKKVLFIDTRHKFNVRNFVSILCHFDKDLSRSIGNSQEERKQTLAKPLSSLYEEYPAIVMYLERVQVLECYTPEDLMLTFGPPNESVVQKLLLQDSKVCLVVVDSIDNYSFSESMLTTAWAHEWPDIMQNLKLSVSSTRCPVICSTLIPADNFVYQNNNKRNSTLQANTRNTGDCSQRSKSTYNNSPNAVTTTDASSATATTTHNQQKETDKICASNFPIDYTVFTNILELAPVPEAEKAKLVHPFVKKITHCVVAYLRSRHNANTAGSGGNQRVKFSIFSDMLWVM